MYRVELINVLVPLYLLYADDTCLICMGRDIKTIEDQLNKDFNSFCEWFVDNKLSIHFGEKKTKSILFGTTKRLKSSCNLDIRYKDIEIKQHSKVSYLGCILMRNHLYPFVRLFFLSVASYLKNRCLATWVI